MTTSLLLDRMFNLSAKPTNPNMLKQKLKSTMSRDISVMLGMLVHHVAATKILHRELASRRPFPLQLPKVEDILNQDPTPKIYSPLTSHWSDGLELTRSTARV